jgi:predicted dehydrogenase
VPQDFMFGGCGHPIDALRWLLGDVQEVHCLAGEAIDLARTASRLSQLQQVDPQPVPDPVS